MKKNFHYVMKNDLPSMRKFFNILDNSGFHAVLSPRQQNVLFLVLDEMISNVIKFAGSPDIRIEIDLSFDDPGLMVHLSDNGPNFNPWNVPPPPDSGPVDSLAIGGRGIDMVRKATISREHAYKEGRNILKIRIT